MSENLPVSTNLNESTDPTMGVPEKETTPVTPIEVLNPVDQRLEELSGKLMEELDECSSNEDFMEILKRYVEVVGYDAVETIFIIKKAPDPYLKYLGYLKDENTFRNAVEAIAGPSYRVCD